MVNRELQIINTYYDYLKELGYLSNKEVLSILAYLSIIEIIQYSIVSKYITDKDLLVFKNYLSKLSQCSCIINSTKKYEGTNMLSIDKDNYIYGIFDTNNQLYRISSLIDKLEMSDYEFFVVKK